MTELKLATLNEKRIPFRVPAFSRFYELAAAAVVVTTAVANSIGAAATAAAAEDEDKDDYPRTIVTTKVTHLRKPPFLFSSHTMQRNKSVLLFFLKSFMFSMLKKTVVLNMGKIKLDFS